MSPKDPNLKAAKDAEEALDKRKNISYIRNTKDIKKTYNEIDTTLNDFYTQYNRNNVDPDMVKEYEKSISSMTQAEIDIMNTTKTFYEIEFERKGGLVMPIIYLLEYEDGSNEEIRIPAEIWRKGETKITKVHASDKKINKIILDPYLETADIDTENNYYPKEDQSTKFEIFKRTSSQRSQQNPMQKSKRVATP